MYRLLLRLLPRHRRVAYGDEMADVFIAARDTAARHGGRPAVFRTWLREVATLFRFAGRERLNAINPFGGPMGSEIRWAWRGVQSRGWRALFVVGLFGVVLAANAVVFAAADAFVFRTVPFHAPEQLVVFTERSDVSGVHTYTNRGPLLAWRSHTDLFAGIQAHDTGASAYMTNAGITEVVRTHRVTPGMFELLGVLPQHGRPFVDADAEPGAPATAVVGHTLARQLFGDAALAVGRTLDEAPDKPLVIGVMPETFRFPSATEQIWRPLNLDTVRDNVGVGAVARLRDGWTIDAAARTYLERLPAIVEGLPEGFMKKIFQRELAEGAHALSGYADHQRKDGVATIFAVLVGAAGCLLLIACANVTSLELAAAAGRRRTLAVCTALGARRASLIRVALLEGGLLLVVSLGLALVLSKLGLATLTAQLTTTMRDALTNPLDLDLRTLLFMALVATLTWGLTTLPVLTQVSRLAVVSGLRHDPRTMPVTKGAARSRQMLMTMQVAMTVLLLIVGMLFVRAYAQRVGQDKGFDARGLLTLGVWQAPDARRDAAVLTNEILDRLRGMPGVQSVSQAGALPPSTQAGAAGKITIAGRNDDLGSVMLSMNSVEPEYFTTMSIQAVEGRLFDDTTAKEHVVIDEKLARRFWPNQSALGAKFQIGKTGQGGVSEFEVIGVSRSLRADRVLNDAGVEVYFGFIRLSPTYRPLSFVLRVDNETRMPMILEAVRSLGTRLVVRGDTVEARYRRLEADNRLASAITSGFGTLAWVIAAAGIYAVMAYLVAGRTREIGIRMALGADAARVRRMVLTSSVLFVTVGTALGVTGALVASRWIETRLAGVSPTDPLTYGGVVLLVVLTGITATWLPARRASRIDPAITLRAE